MNGSLKKTLSICAVIMAMVAPSIVAAQTTLKLAHQFAPDSLPGKSAIQFADKVAEKTGGRIKVQVLPAGSLGDERANLQQLTSGSIDLALVGDLVTSYMARPYMLVSMPFIYDTADHAQAVFRGEIGKELNQYLHDQHGIAVLGWQYVDTRQLSANTPIKTLADLKGLKLRLFSSEVVVKTWEKTGVHVVNIAFNELYLALQTGTVSAQENPPNFTRAQKFYEVQKHLMTTNHMPQMQAFFVNAKRLGELSKEDRQAILDAGQEVVTWTSQTAADTQKSDTEWLTTQGGMQLVNIDLTGIQDVIKDVPREILGDDGVKLYERIRQVTH